MIGSYARPGRGTGWVRRGDARFLVLEVLKEKPMHGYEVGKAIANLFDGLYEPSPGVVYPNLQWLEDEGMVESVRRAGKKVYQVTDGGRKFAEEGREELLRLLEVGRDTSKGARWQLMIEGKQLEKMLAFAFPGLTDETARRATSILKDARQRIERLVEA